MKNILLKYKLILLCILFLFLTFSIILYSVGQKRYTEFIVQNLTESLNQDGVFLSTVSPKIENWHLEAESCSLYFQSIFTQLNFENIKVYLKLPTLTLKPFFLKPKVYITATGYNGKLESTLNFSAILQKRMFEQSGVISDGTVKIENLLINTHPLFNRFGLSSGILNLKFVNINNESNLLQGNLSFTLNDLSKKNDSTIFIPNFIQIYLRAILTNFGLPANNLYLDELTIPSFENININSTINMQKEFFEIQNTFINSILGNIKVNGSTSLVSGEYFFTLDVVLTKKGNAFFGLYLPLISSNILDAEATRFKVIINSKASKKINFKN